MRRRKYLLSGLLSCGQCGGNLTIAGSGKPAGPDIANAAFSASLPLVPAQHQD
ncbi:hypothetical protein METH_17260 [Leisingera methylohalidivorans DSM 14336]|uniref:Uncharacterized protein n=2 Tax=Leisingera methylohalidivorans TaxID=133924 RepID=V9W0S2_9RHOB|nr:hypothetical protein METH_17260 [Leisingera methylohalidivorans DSM 14336]